MESYIDALVAVASVGAVLWTGGLIVRQLYPTYVSINLQNGMYFAMFASLAAIGGLFLNGLPLQTAAGLFMALYAYWYMKDLKYIYDLNADLEKVPQNIPDPVKYKADAEQATLYEGYLLLPYVAVIQWPNQFCIACIGFVLLYVGYQLMLKHLLGAKADTSSVVAQVAQGAGTLAILNTLQEMLGLLKQKL